MTGRAVRMLLAVLLGLGLGLGLLEAAVPAGAASGDAVSVQLNRPTLTTKIGQRFTFHSTVRNSGSSTATGLVAHLNIVSLDPSVYVDPEDWSSRRTVYLPDLPGHDETRLRWDLQAVNDGRLVVYVALYDNPDGPVVASANPLRLTVTAARTLNAGGVLPIALGVPALLLLLLLVNVGRRRRLR